MDSFEWNKIAGAVLASLLLILLLRWGAEELYHHDALEANAYPIEVPEEPAAGEDGEAAEDEGPSLAMILAGADASSGEAAFKRKCATCHTIAAGGGALTGPNLHDIVGRDIASVGGFSYSSVLEDKPGGWDYEALDGFLASPRGWANGTKMAFVGLRRDEERADVIAYLKENSENPPPFPEVAAVESEEAEGDVETDEAPIVVDAEDEGPAEAGEAVEEPADVTPPVEAEAENVVEGTDEATPRNDAAGDPDTP